MPEWVRFSLLFAAAAFAASAQPPQPLAEKLHPVLQKDSRWSLANDGGITWDVRPGDAHQDRIEMSGKKVSVIVTYGARENSSLVLALRLAFPSLRTVPNDKSATLSYVFEDDATTRFLFDGKPAPTEKVTRFHHRGILSIESKFGEHGDVTLVRSIFPSTENPLVLENYRFTNHSGRQISIEVESDQQIVRTDPKRGVTGAYIISARVLQTGAKRIAPGKSVSFGLASSAREASSDELNVDLDAEERARRTRIETFLSELQLETPDPMLNTAFAFSKIRAAESIYLTKGGLMHGSGGGGYATIWANDQIEYANPFFPFLGDPAANQAAINALNLFARYMNPDYRPLPNAVVAEGTGSWNGPGDRGDMAMIAYGAARFVLAYGDPDTGKKLWNLITWCLEYCRRKVNAHGVVASDSDELEGRFPAGKANLCTSALYYDALNSAVMLGRELGASPLELSAYQEQAGKIRAAIETFFGTKIQGFDAYRYYDGNTALRAWVAVPLTMGIYDRKVGTLAALFSPVLWTQDGVRSLAGEETFFDRSTLYALRGAFAAGDTERGLSFLDRYTRRRLLGDHVPYPIEWGPQGSQPHLAAESALYCRVYTEGLFGIRPAGLHSFVMTPRLPTSWDRMRLRNIHAFGSRFDLLMTRAGDKLQLETTVGGKRLAPQLLPQGQAIRLDLSQMNPSL